MRRRLVAAVLAAVALAGAPLPAGSSTLPTQRVAGASRYETAVALSRFAFPSDPTNPSASLAPAVVVATGADFADGLAAGPFAAKVTSPLLLVPSSGPVPTVVLDEIRRIHPSRIVVAGGVNAVGTDVEAALAPLVASGAVTRLSGDSRYATAAALAGVQTASVSTSGGTTATGVTIAPGVTTGGTVYLASGEDFPDALTAGSAAGAQRAPLLLTRHDALPQVTAAALTALAPSRVVVVGGTVAVDSTVETAVKALLPTAVVSRVSGADRFTTAATVARTTAPAAGVAYLASGESFADALGGGAAAGTDKLPLLLSHQGCVPVPTLQALLDLQVQHVVILGGTSVLTTDVATLTPCA